MVARENKNNAYAKFGGTTKEYYGIFRSGLLLVKVKDHSVDCKQCDFTHANLISSHLTNFKLKFCVFLACKDA